MARQTPRTLSPHSGLQRPHSAGRFCIFSHLLLAPGRVSRCGPALQHHGTDAPRHTRGGDPQCFCSGHLPRSAPAFAFLQPHRDCRPPLSDTHPWAPSSSLSWPSPGPLSPQPVARLPQEDVLLGAWDRGTGSTFWSPSRGGARPLLLPPLSPPLSWPGTGARPPGAREADLSGGGRACLEARQTHVDILPAFGRSLLLP